MTSMIVVPNEMKQIAHRNLMSHLLELNPGLQIDLTKRLEQDIVFYMCQDFNMKMMVANFITGKRFPIDIIAGFIKLTDAVYIESIIRAHLLQDHVEYKIKKYSSILDYINLDDPMIKGLIKKMYPNIK